MSERNNFQDEAEVREFRKGERAGKAQADKTARRNGKKSNKSNNNNKSRANRSRNKSNTNARSDNNRSRQDFSWYNTYPQLVQDVARLDFARPTGDMLPSLDRIQKTYGGVTINNNPKRLPGILTVSLVPTVGLSTDAQSPFNAGTRALFSYLRQSRSGTAPYEMTDLGMMFDAAADAYSYVNFLGTIYAEATQYSVFNKYLPLAMLTADGVNPEDVIANRSQFRSSINYLITKLSQFKIPSSISLIKRRAFLYSAIYQEGTSIRDQIYKYVPAGFSKLVDGTSENPATSITVVPFAPPSGGYTTAQLIAYGMELIDALSSATSGSFAYMQADILNTFGTSESAYVQLAYIPDETAIALTRDANVMYQIKNARPVWAANAASQQLNNLCKSASITQSTDVGLTYAISAPTISYAATGTTPSAGAVADMLVRTQIPIYIDVPSAEPTVEELMEFTRLAPVPTITQDVADPDLYSLTYACGSEIPYQMSYWMYDNNMSVVQNVIPSYGNATSVTGAQMAKTAEIISNFSYHPMSLYYTLSNNAVSDFNFIWDFDNYAAVHVSDMEDLHRVALLSEFAVPTVNAH